MDDPEEHAKVMQALTCTLGNSVFWKGKARDRAATDSELQGLTTTAILADLRNHARSGGEIEQKRESREDWADDFDFVHIALLEYDFLLRPLFVEMCLIGDDPEFPEVAIVSAHLSFKQKTR